MSLFILQVIVVVLVGWLLWDLTRLRQIYQNSVYRRFNNLVREVTNNLSLQQKLKTTTKKALQKTIEESELEEKENLLLSDSKCFNSILSRVEKDIVPFRDFFIGDIFPPKCKRDFELLQFKQDYKEMELQFSMELYSQDIRKICDRMVKKEAANQLAENQIKQTPDHMEILNLFKEKYPTSDEKKHYLGFTSSSHPSEHKIKLRVAQKRKQIEDSLRVIQQKGQEDKWREKLMELEFLKIVQKELTIGS